MGVEDAFDLIDIDAQRIEAVRNVGSSVNQVDASLKCDDAGHAGAVGIPSISLARVCDCEVISTDLMCSKFIGCFIGLSLAQIQIDLHRVPFVAELVDIEAKSTNKNPISNLRCLITNNAVFKQILCWTDIAEGKAELHSHHFIGNIRRNTSRFDLLQGNQTVVTPIDIVHL